MRQKQSIISLFLLSPSSRRAWIEMPSACQCWKNKSVALLAEGVDRNALVLGLIRLGYGGRPPRGGRG